MSELKLEVSLTEVEIGEIQAGYEVIKKGLKIGSFPMDVVIRKIPDY